jgi:hypothetical protein
MSSPKPPEEFWCPDSLLEMGAGDLSQGCIGQGVNFTTHHLSVPRLRMSGTMLLLPTVKLRCVDGKLPFSHLLLKCNLDIISG